MNTPRLSRRALLRGAGGIGIALPFLEIMNPRRAYAASPKRFIVFFSPNGMNDPASFFPKATGATGTLPYETSPLEPLKAKTLLLSNLSSPSAYAQEQRGDQHANGMCHLLTCAKMVPGPKPVGKNFGEVLEWGGGISIDQKIAQTIAAPTRFSSIQLGVQTTTGIGAHPFSRMSYTGPAQPVPSQDDPREVWTRLFSELPSAPGAAAVPGVLDQAREQRKSALDFVLPQYTSLQQKLSMRDRHTLDGHLTAIRAVEKRLSTPALVAAGCQRPNQPPATVSPGIDPTACGNSFGLCKPQGYPEIGKLQMDLLALAIACDLTRVASFQWSWAHSEIPMPWVGINTSHHELTHGKPSQTLSNANRWYCEQLVYFASALNAVNEGNASALDNSVVWWCSEISNGPTHGFNNLRTVLVGSCGGYFKTGQHLSLNGGTDNQLMVTFMRAMGIDTATSFGDPTPKEGPLAGLG